MHAYIYNIEIYNVARYWVPLVWAGNIVGRARQENRVREDLSMINILQGIAKFRGGCGDLLAYDWVRKFLLWLDNNSPERCHILSYSFSRFASLWCTLRQDEKLHH